ncbi:MAG TPA: transposase domain-containing protein [Candidatus Merdenecus merdavium]|nr:transposase domain-containing protein [Candidatus Merdenecus merdavium]
MAPYRYHKWCKGKCYVYSIAETAKANNLKPYNYFKYILEEIPKHMDEKNTKFLEDLLPWSKNLPEECKKQRN